MMQRFCLIILWMVFTLLAGNEKLFAQQTETLLSEATRLESLMQEKSALQKYKELVVIQSTHPDALYKCSELCSRIGAREKNDKKKQEYYDQAMSYAQKMLKYYPQSEHTYVAMAIAMGKQALSKTGKEKIQFVRDIKSNAEKALQINNANYKAWHVMGKWNYEMTQLNFMERAIVKVFFGGLPDASLKSSISAYRQAEKLHADFMLNNLELAKALYANDQTQDAIQRLRQLLKMSVRTEDDPIVQMEARDLLKKWK